MHGDFSCVPDVNASLVPIKPRVWPTFGMFEKACLGAQVIVLTATWLEMNLELSCVVLLEGKGIDDGNGPWMPSVWLRGGSTNEV